MSGKQTILIATANHGKAEEIKRIFQDSDFDLRFLFDFPDKFKDIEIMENAKSFEGNALIKAIIAGDVLGMITLADDSGLCVDALNGEPGVFSGRYSGRGTDQSNWEKLLQELEGISFDDRNCHYNCTVAIYDPKTKFVETVSGVWDCKVAQEARGNKSFGYAPVILAKDFGYQKTNAECEPEELIGINHRGKVFKKAMEILKGYLGDCTSK